MRLEIIRQVFLKELRETLRDRRSLAAMFGIPLLLYPMLTLGMATLTASTQRRMTRQTSRVAIKNPEAAPHLVERLERLDSGVRIVSATAAKESIAANRVDAVLLVPPHAEADALASREVQIHIQLDRSRSASDFTQRKLDRILDDYEKWIIEERLRAHGMPVSLMRPLESVTDDVATGDRRMGRLLALMLPMMLLMTGLFGAFFPAVNATTAERELGTLETLLVTPARKMELLVAKGGLVLLLGLLTAGLNMLSMALVFWRTTSMAMRGAESLTINPAALALTYLAAVPTIILCAATALVVGLFARNYREANSYATPIFLLPLVPMIVSMMEPKTTPGLLVTPIVNTTIVIRDVLTGHATAGAFLLAFASSCLYAGLLLSLAARLFTTEGLVNPAWEPLSLKGLRGAARRGTRRLPAVDEALALFAVSMLLLFYVSPSWQKAGFLVTVIGNELLLIAAPTLLFAWLMRYRWIETFSWRRPTGAEMAGAALIGVGVLPWVYALASAQGRFWPQDPEVARVIVKMLVPDLQQRPFLTPIVVGVLAGMCEELLYRGPLQTALARRLPAPFALGLGAILFAAAHMDAHGMLFRMILGLILGWIVLRGGSIFPAMVMHTVADATHFALHAWIVHTWGADRYVEMATRPDTPIAGPWGTEWAIGGLALGAVLLLLGWGLCLSAHRRKAVPVAQAV
jgi:sodium transport system permease protein